jgi:hypothetical protein
LEQVRRHLSDPAQLLAKSYHLVVDLQQQLSAQRQELEEQERRWSDPTEVRRRLDELAGHAVTYAAVVVAVIHVAAALTGASLT